MVILCVQSDKCLTPVEKASSWTFLVKELKLSFVDVSRSLDGFVGKLRVIGEESITKGFSSDVLHSVIFLMDIGTISS